VISSQKLEQNKDKKNFVKLTTKRRLMLLILTIALTFFLIYFLRYYFADIKYAEGENFSKIGEYQKAAQLLNQANTLKYDHVYEDKLSYTLANIAFIASYQKQNDVAEKMMKTADLLNNKSIVAAAKNVLYWKTKAKNHYLFYQITLDPLELKVALDALEKARLIAPSDPKIPYSLAIFYSLLADEAKKNNEKLKYNRLSLIEIDKSIDLKNNYRDGYFLKGQILKKTSRFEEAKKVFNFILHNLNPDDNEVKKELDSI